MTKHASTDKTAAGRQPDVSGDDHVKTEAEHTGVTKEMREHAEEPAAMPTSDRQEAERAFIKPGQPKK